MLCLYFLQSTTAQAADPACASDYSSRILLCPEAHQEFCCKTKFTDLAESLLLQEKNIFWHFNMTEEPGKDQN